jgi:hypothetical protein
MYEILENAFLSVQVNLVYKKMVLFKFFRQYAWRPDRKCKRSSFSLPEEFAD